MNRDTETMDILRNIETPPIVSFKDSLQIHEKYILNSNSLKLTTLRTQGDFLERLCLFVLEEALLKTSKETVTLYLKYILNMDKDIDSLAFIKKEVVDNIIVQIIVSAVTKINLFGSTSYSKRQKIGLLDDYVEWCKNYLDIEGDVVPVIRFEELLERLRTLQTRKGRVFNNVNYIQANGRLVQVSCMSADKVLDKDTCVEYRDKIKDYFIYTPAGVFAIGNCNTNEFVFWSSSLDELQLTLCAMIKH